MEAGRRISLGGFPWVETLKFFLGRNFLEEISNSFPFGGISRRKFPIHFPLREFPAGNSFPRFLAVYFPREIVPHIFWQGISRGKLFPRVSGRVFPAGNCFPEFLAGYFQREISPHFFFAFLNPHSSQNRNLTSFISQTKTSSSISSRTNWPNSLTPVKLACTFFPRIR